MWSFVLGFWLFHCELSFLSPDSGFICHVMFGLTFVMFVFVIPLRYGVLLTGLKPLCFLSQLWFLFSSSPLVTCTCVLFVTVLPYQLLRLLLRSSDKLIFWVGVMDSVFACSFIACFGHWFL